MKIFFINYFPGAVWIYPHTSDVQHTNPDKDKYCDGTLFKFGLALSVIDGIIVGGVVLIALFVWYCHYFGDDCCD